MGQEISQQRATCKNYSRRQYPCNPVQNNPIQNTNNGENSHHHSHYDYMKKQSSSNLLTTQKADLYHHDKHTKFSRVKIVNGHTNYLKHKDPVYTSSSISNSSSTDDEEYKQYQKYNLTKQSYEKTRISKQQQQQQLGGSDFQKFSGGKCLEDSSSSSSDYHSYMIEGDHQHLHQSKRHHQRNDFKAKHQRNISSHSTTTDSGIYYSSSGSTIHTPPFKGYSLSNASVNSGRTTSALDSQKSNKSLAKQKEYLEHHLYIKSYLDILEEDERARAAYKVAKPGGIRNYTPKILADICLSSSAPVRHEDPWI